MLEFPFSTLPRTFTPHPRTLPQIHADFLRRCPPPHVESMRFVCEPPEFFAARVLRARKYDAAAALKLVAETAAWREEIKIRELCAKDPFDVLGCMEDELQVR